jgi:hypothetical protein
VGWVKEEEHRPALDAFLTTSRTRVADVDGVPECMVASVPGTLRYLKQDLATPPAGWWERSGR